MLRAVVVCGVLLVLGVAGRLLPHVANFTPVAAIALFAGFLFRRRLVAAAIPLAIMFASDAFLGPTPVGVKITVYLAILFPLVFAPLLRKRLSPVRIGGSALIAALFFYVVTTFAVWLAYYPQTLGGFLECYGLGLPFLAKKLLGDLLWSGAIFGTYAVIKQVRTRKVGLVKATVLVRS
ncbi:MAG: DUF6580 family putative transport protein [Phycisphaerales bacterium]